MPARRTPDDARPDDARPDDATPDDATPDDATPDDATPDGRPDSPGPQPGPQPRLGPRSRPRLGPRSRDAMFAALAVPNFRRYISGQAVSLVGTWVETVAQALLVLRLTHSGAILGLTTQAGLGLVSAALGVLVLTGHIDIWGVVVLALAFGTLSAVDNPARQAFVSELVGAPLVRDAVTLNSTSVNVARVLGPTVAAALVATVGIGWCFVTNAGSFLFVIASLVFLNTRQLHPVRPEPRLPGQVRQGLRYAAGIPAIARPLLMMALVGTFTFEFEVSLPLLAEKTFHGNATTYSLLLGSLGAGAVAGGLYAAQAARTGVTRLTRISVAYALTMALLAVMPTVWSAMIACVLVGVASLLFLTTGNATVQLAADPGYRGRVMALWSTALVGSTPIGSPVIGALSDAFSPRSAILLGAVACAAAAAIGRWPARTPKTPKTATTPKTPTNGLKAP